MTIIWSPTARSKTKDILEYISKDNPTSALTLIDQIEEKVEKLRQNPEMGRILPETNTQSIRDIVIHKNYGVEPDMAMFGKALGNGYAVTATIGRREVMESAQSTFISSTFWTERAGPAAALKTLEIMEIQRPQRLVVLDRRLKKYMN